MNNVGTAANKSPEIQGDILAMFDPLASSASSQNISASNQNNFLASVFGDKQQNHSNQEIPGRSPSPERQAQTLPNDKGKQR